MYEGLILLLINRFQETKRYEIIIELLNDPTLLTNDEIRHLLSLLDKEFPRVDEDAKMLIILEQSKFPQIELESARSSIHYSKDEAELLEGMIICLNLAFGVMGITGSARTSTSSRKSSFSGFSRSRRPSGQSQRRNSAIPGLSKLSEMYESKGSSSVADGSSRRYKSQIEQEEAGEAVPTAESALPSDITVSPDSISRRISQIGSKLSRVFSQKKQ
jgi:hypothetical protein